MMKGLVGDVMTSETLLDHKIQRCIAVTSLFGFFAASVAAARP